MGYNVFADLELPKPNELFLRASLLLALGDLMRSSGLTQIEIAQKAGLKQPEVSRIMRGNDRGFSTDRLARIAFNLGYLPTIDLKPMASPRRSPKPAGLATKKALAILSRSGNDEPPKAGDEIPPFVRRKTRKSA
jgi:predicted XRE-type DNA-binding protein